MTLRKPGDAVVVRRIIDAWSYQGVTKNPHDDVLGRRGVVCGMDGTPGLDGMYAVWLEGFADQDALPMWPEELGPLRRRR